MFPMASGAKQSRKAPRRWTRPLVATCTAFATCAGVATNFTALPTPLRFDSLIIFVTVTFALSWYGLPETMLKKIPRIMQSHRRSGCRYLTLQQLALLQG
jgi:hypothetical protein